MEIISKTGLTEIILEGTSFERGVQHGTLLRSDINDFLDSDLARINIFLSRPLERDQLAQVTGPYAEMIEQYLPGIMEELKGLALGAEISLQEAILLQIRRELIGVGGFTLQGDCSSFGWHTGSRPVIGQTIDLNGGMTGLGQVFRMKASESQIPEILMYSFAGLLGYMGMNSCGLAVTINLVISDGWRAGIPPYLLVRKFLECKTIEECLLLVQLIPRASSRSFIIADQNKQVTLEVTPTDYRVIEGTFLAHTNHYLHPDFKHSERMNIFSHNSSSKRLRLLQEKLGKNDPGIKDIQAVFADHTFYPVGTCAHNMDNILQNETVAAIIMYPEDGIFWALKGRPCHGSYEQFILATVKSAKYLC